MDLLSLGKLPGRVTHDDTKLTCIMIDDGTGESGCVIDLDTVTPGSSLYDFSVTLCDPGRIPDDRGLLISGRLESMGGA